MNLFDRCLVSIKVGTNKISCQENIPFISCTVTAGKCGPEKLRMQTLFTCWYGVFSRTFEYLEYLYLNILLKTTYQTKSEGSGITELENRVMLYDVIKPR